MLKNKAQKLVTQVGQNWNQLVSELKKWEEFGVELNNLNLKDNLLPAQSRTTNKNATELKKMWRGKSVSYTTERHNES